MLLVVVGTINAYPPPADGWDVKHVDLSARGIYDKTIQRCRPIDIVADMRNLPFEDGSVDRVQSWHALEHVNQQGGVDTVHEFRRVLRTGGVLDLRVPDLDFAKRSDDIADVLPLLYGDQVQMADAEMNAHKWGYTERTLRELVATHGFSAVERVPAEHADEIHLLCS